MEKKGYRQIYSGGVDKTCVADLHARLISIDADTYLYETQEGNTYQIRLPISGQSMCTCPDYIKRLDLQSNGKYTSNGYKCKHILTLESLLKRPIHAFLQEILPEEELRNFEKSLPKEDQNTYWGITPEEYAEISQELPDITEVSDAIWKNITQ